MQEISRLPEDLLGSVQQNSRLCKFCPEHLVVHRVNVTVKVKVKFSRYRPEEVLGDPER
jgi:hypothetical protein